MDRALPWSFLKVFGLADNEADFLAQLTLPYGQQRKLEIARALSNRSEAYFLLDEPAAGMNPNETEELNGYDSFR